MEVLHEIIDRLSDFIGVDETRREYFHHVAMESEEYKTLLKTIDPAFGDYIDFAIYTSLNPEKFKKMIINTVGSPELADGAIAYFHYLIYKYSDYS